MNKKRMLSNLLLLIVALIWGTAFVAQDIGMDYVEPFTFTATRNLVAIVALFPLIYFLQKRKIKMGNTEPLDKKMLIRAGVSCGLVLFAAASLQQYGILHGTIPAKAGFITALYIIFVPLIGLFSKRRVRPIIWVCVFVAVIGLYLLCVSDGLGSIIAGDFMMMGCAVLFACHIMVIDYYSPKTDSIMMAWLQFFVCGVVATIAMFIFETPTWESIKAGYITIIYSGMISSGIGYTGQIVAQKNTNPTVASLIMSLESVFAVLAGAIILGQNPSNRELLGCTIMFAAIIVAQLPERKKS